VDSANVGLVLLDMGACVGCAADMNGNGFVDSADVGLVLLTSGGCS